MRLCSKQSVPLVAKASSHQSAAARPATSGNSYVDEAPSRLAMFCALNKLQGSPVSCYEVTSILPQIAMQMTIAVKVRLARSLIVSPEEPIFSLVIRRNSSTQNAGQKRHELGGASVQRLFVQLLQLGQKVMHRVVRHVCSSHRVDQHRDQVRQCNGGKLVAASGFSILHHASVGAA